MAFLLIASLSFRTSVPLAFADLMKGVVDVKLLERKWTGVEDSTQVPLFMSRYFNVDAHSSQCELFVISGVPAAAMLYDKTDRRGRPVVKEFHMNKGLLVMFQAGPSMRLELFKRFGGVHTTRARNSLEFFTV